MISAELSTFGIDLLYKHLRQHFTNLAIEVDTQQIDCNLQISQINQELIIHQQFICMNKELQNKRLHKNINNIHSLTLEIKNLQIECQSAIEKCNKLFQYLPTSISTHNLLPSLPIFCCNKQSISRILICGWMIRIGSYLKSNKKRWVILFIDGLLAYYSHSDCRVLKGVIDLNLAIEVIPDSECNLNITVKSQTKLNKNVSWHFILSSNKNVLEWLNAIQSLKCIRGKSKTRYCAVVPSNC